MKNTPLFTGIIICAIIAVLILSCTKVPELSPRDESREQIDPSDSNPGERHFGPGISWNPTNGYFIPDSCTIALWHFDNNFRDVFNLHEFTNENAVLVDSPFGRGVELNGADALLYCNALRGYDHALTIEMWVKPYDQTTSGILIDTWAGAPVLYGPTNQRSFSLSYAMDETLHRNISPDGYSIASAATMNGIGSELMYVVYTCDTSGEKIYINGEEIENLHRPTPRINDTAKTYLSIGGNRPNMTDFFHGMIDMVRISSVVRFPNEIHEYWNMASSKVMQWKCQSYIDAEANTTATLKDKATDQTMSSIQNVSLSSSGVIGKSLDFAGNGYINVGMRTISNEMSISFWFNRQSIPLNSGFTNCMVSYNQGEGENSPNYDCRIFLSGTNNIHGRTYTQPPSASDRVEDIFANTILYNSSWHHVVIILTNTASDSKLHMIIDNKITYNGTGTAPNLPRLFDSTINASFFLGAFDTATHLYSGKLDEVGLWDRALNDWEVELLYNNGYGRNPFN